MEQVGGRKEFVSYDYKEIYADNEKLSFLIDSYECFGWEADEKRVSTNTAYSFKSMVPLRRNRKIMNKMELTRLQRNFEACIKEIEALEYRKTSGAAMYALTVGLIGTAFMAGSVFCITAQPPLILLCILLSVPAFLGWIFPYFIYKKTVEKQTQKMIPLIEAKYDEIYEICEKGNKLLYQM